MNIRSFVAIVFGIVLVLGAFYMRNIEIPEQGAIVVATPEANQNVRNYIQVTDSDKDGTSDWEEALAKRTLERVRGLPEVPEIEAHYEEPTTLTGQFAESFFQEYIGGNIHGTLTEDTQEQFLYDKVATLEAQARDTLFATKDITIGKDNSLSALRDYGNEVAYITYLYSTVEDNELEMLDQALKLDDETYLERLDPIIESYKHFIEATKKLPVPPALAKEHLDLLNTYKAVYGDIRSMRSAFNDPLLAMIRVKRYQDDINGLYLALVNIYSHIDKEGVIYAEDEPAGALGIIEQ